MNNSTSIVEERRWSDEASLYKPTASSRLVSMSLVEYAAGGQVVRGAIARLLPSARE